MTEAATLPYAHPSQETDRENGIAEPQNVRLGQSYFSPEHKDVLVYKALLDASQSIRIPRDKMAPLPTETSSGQLAQSASLAECMFYMPQRSGSYSDQELSFQTLPHDLEEKAVAPVGRMTIVHPMMNPIAFMIGLKQNPEAGELKAVELTDVITRSVVLSTASATPEPSVVTLIGREDPEQFNFSCIATDATGSTLDILPLNQENLTAIASDKAKVIGWLEVTHAGDTIISGADVYSQDRGGHLPCLLVTTMDQPDYPYFPKPEEVALTREMLASHMGATTLRAVQQVPPEQAAVQTPRGQAAPASGTVRPLRGRATPPIPEAAPSGPEAPVAVAKPVLEPLPEIPEPGLHFRALPDEPPKRGWFKR